MKLYQNRDWLYQKYIVEKLSEVEIGEMCGLWNTTISYNLIKYNIPRRSRSEYNRRIKKKEGNNKDWLYQKYIIEKMCARQIAKLCNCSRTTIAVWLTKYNIPRRSAKDYSYSEERKIRMSGKNHPMFGKHHTKETREKISKSNTGKIISEETREKISKSNKGENCYWFGKHHTEETNMKISKSRKELGLKGEKSSFYGKHHTEKNKRIFRERQIKYFQNPENRKIYKERTKENWQNPDYVEKVMSGLEKTYNRRPTNPEKVFDELTPDIVRYVGNGAWWRNHHNPDFKIKGQNKVIEIYGDYWHRNDNPKDRIREYKEMGLECLVFWEHEVYEDTKRILKEVNEFIRIEKPFQPALAI